MQWWCFPSEEVRRVNSSRRYSRRGGVTRKVRSPRCERRAAENDEEEQRERVRKGRARERERGTADRPKPGIPTTAAPSGSSTSSNGNVIEETANKHNLNVIPGLLGHGIGTYFHGAPDIYHFANDFPEKLKAGMTFTIEPALSQGTTEIEILEDGWTACTVDNSRAAQTEHTILITDTGCEVLTL